MKLIAEIETSNEEYKSELGAVIMSGYVRTAMMSLAYYSDDFHTPGTNRILDENGDDIGTITVEP